MVEYFTKDKSSNLFIGSNMQVRIIAIRLDDCYFVSSLAEIETITLKNILEAMTNETVFDEFLVIDSRLNQTRIFNRKKFIKDEEEE